MHLTNTGSPSGKLTVAEHRCSILAALEALTKCPLSVGSQQQLATSATEGLITYIKQEGSLFSLSESLPVDL